LTVDQSANKVDANTLERKLMMGYQGWFGCTGDGSEANWWHWSLDNRVPNSSNLSIDMWPDVTEFGSSEVFPTGMTYFDLTQASLYSAYIASVVDRHFAWMEGYGLDGVMLQRFVCDLDLHDQTLKDFRDRVASNVKTAAEAHGRVFCIMYDITGYNGTSLADDIEKDWQHLVSDDVKITGSPSYLKHKGKGGLKQTNPLLAIWGMGFSDGPGTKDRYPATPEEALNLINYFKNNNVTILGGVPYKWRTLESPDSKTDQAWAQVYRSFDVISPWSVGRYRADSVDAIQQIDSIQLNTIKDDLRGLSGKVDYMPVVFPGYSQHNTKPNKPLNEIKRYGGTFWWRQLHNAVDIAKCIMIYGAMFDEVNEGTAMFKLVANKQGLPREAQENLVHLNIDQDEVPDGLKNLTSDQYLWLAGETNRRLRDGTKFTSTMPTRDQPPSKPSSFRRALSLVRRHS
jgi:hypothetical protein